MEILSLIKFGQKEHLEEMLNNGTIYCNPIEYFRKLEDSELRGDSYEGTFKITNYPPNSKIEITLHNNLDKPIKLKTASLHLREHYSNIKGNLFCLYCLTSEDFKNINKFKIDLKNVGFGSHFLLLKDLKNILPRITNAFDNCEFEYVKGLVQYYDRRTKNGNVTPFEKPLEYAYQKEFRFFVNSGMQKPIKLHIGPLNDVAQIFEMSELQEMEYIYNSDLKRTF